MSPVFSLGTLSEGESLESEMGVTKRAEVGVTQLGAMTSQSGESGKGQGSLGHLGLGFLTSRTLKIMNLRSRWAAW